jgi:hypothetical protein
MFNLFVWKLKHDREKGERQREREREREGGGRERGRETTIEVHQTKDSK